MLSSDEEAPENPVVQVHPLLPPELLNRAHANAALPPVPPVNDENADMVIMFKLRVDSLSVYGFMVITFVFLSSTWPMTRKRLKSLVTVPKSHTTDNNIPFILTSVYCLCMITASMASDRFRE